MDKDDDTKETVAEAKETPSYANKNTWLRGLFMLIFLVLFYFAQMILGLVTLIQFLWTLFDSKPNASLTAFGSALGKWLGAVALFQCCASEDKPFPWAPWPKA